MPDDDAHAMELSAPQTGTGESLTRQISVIVCTRRRPLDLRRCLASLQSVDDANYEVIVVENDDRAALGSGDAAQAGARVVVEPRIGLCFARNRGLAEARGEIVAFVDDDCEAHPRWLAELRAAFRDPAVTCVTGRVLPASESRHSHRWFEHFSTFDRGPTPRRRRYVDERPPFFFSAAALGSGCNMAFRRTVFDRLGRFDPVFDVGAIRGGGDLDLFGRVLEAGETAVYSPCAVIRHHHRDTMGGLCRQLFGYGVGMGALCMKHVVDGPGRVSDIVAFQREWLSATARIIGRRRLVARPVGVFLTAIMLAGMVCAPVPYLRHRRSRERTTV